MRNIILLLLLIFTACTANKKDRTSFDADDKYFNTISINDIKLNDPLPGEWRYQHKEAYQSFKDYQGINPKPAERVNQKYIFNH